MNAKQILNNIKLELGLATDKEVVEQEEVVMSEDVKETEVAETEVELAEEEAKEVKKEAEVAVAFATIEQVENLKVELLSMIKAIIEDKGDASDKEVPQELSKEVELKEDTVEEIIHSPEEVVAKERINFNTQNSGNLTALQRVAAMLSK